MGRIAAFLRFNASPAGVRVPRVEAYRAPIVRQVS